MHRRPIAPAAALLAALLGLLVRGSYGSAPRTVVEVIDGDTVRLSDAETVRLLGIDTPERGEPLYEHAARFLAHLAEGRQVVLEFDRTRRDPYRRLLAHLWIADTLAGERLVERGLARVYLWPPDTLHFGRLVAAQTHARRSRRGLWSLVQPAPESLYVIHPQRLRFHRPGCRQAPGRAALPRSDRDSLLDLGFSACRTCRP